VSLGAGDPYDVTTDGSGNVYVTGDAGDGFLTKLSAATGAVLWTQQVGNTWGTGVAMDGGGNVYVAGQFYDSSQFGPFTLTKTNSYQGFVTKLDAARNFLWAKATEGSGGFDAEDVAVDGSGNVYVTGGYAGTVDFDPGPGTYNLTSMGGSDIFVWKLDTAGNFVWAGSMGSVPNDHQNGNGAIALDRSSNVYVAGGWGDGPSSRNDFDPGPGTLKLTNKGARDIYVVKLTSAGNLVWARSMGGSGEDKATDIVVDSSGNVYTTGGFFGSVDFDPGKGNVTLTAAAEDVFVSKLTSAGNFAAAVRMGGAEGDVGWGIAVDGSNNVYTTGQFRGTADFDPGPGTYNLTSAGAADIFVSKLTQSSPLLAAGGAASAGSSAETLTLPQVQPLLDEAVARWQAAGVDPLGLATLEVRIADLPGATLGLASGSTIWLDVNAAGWGWFLDPTPSDDREFTIPGDQGEQDRMDLLTVLAHELGHLLGLEHDDEGVMHETLAAGVRELPSLAAPAAFGAGHSTLDAAFAAQAEWDVRAVALTLDSRTSRKR
jgi:hypothetical protein